MGAGAGVGERDAARCRCGCEGGPASAAAAAATPAPAARRGARVASARPPTQPRPPPPPWGLLLRAACTAHPCRATRQPAGPPTQAQVGIPRSHRRGGAGGGPAGDAARRRGVDGRAVVRVFARQGVGHFVHQVFSHHLCARVQQQLHAMGTAGQPKSEAGGQGRCLVSTRGSRGGPYGAAGQVQRAGRALCGPV